MAIDIKLFDNGDVGLENGDLAFVEGADEVIQASTSRILTIQGEYVYNLLLGLPWFSKMFSIETSYEEKKKIIRDSLVGTPGLTRLTKFIFNVDPINKGAHVNYEAETEYGPISSEVIQ